MSKSKELLKNTAILMVAKLATHLVSFILMPLYTSVLSTEEYGESDIYGSIATVLLPFLTLQIEMSLFFFFISDKSDKDRKQTVTSSFCIAGGCIAAGAVAFLIISLFITVKYRFYLLLYYSMLAVMAVLLQAARAKGDNLCYGAATFLSSFISILLNLLFVVYFKFGVRGILSTQIISCAVTSLYIVFKTRIYQYFSPRSFGKAKSRRMLGYSVPLIFNQLSSWIINYSDRLIILKLFNLGINGIYAVANKFSNILTMLFNMYMIAWTENIIRNKDSDDNEEYFSKVINLSFNAYQIIITFIMNLLPFLFNWLVNKSFHEAYFHIPLLLMASFFYGMAAMIGSIYVAYGKTKQVSITSFLSAFINLAVHFSLVFVIGLYAASVSTIVSFMLLFVYRLIKVHSFCKIRIRFSLIVIPMIVMTASCMAYYSRNTVFILCGTVLNTVNAIVLFMRNKRMIKNLLV